MAYNTWIEPDGKIEGEELDDAYDVPVTFAPHQWSGTEHEYCINCAANRGDPTVEGETCPSHLEGSIPKGWMPKTGTVRKPKPWKIDWSR